MTTPVLQVQGLHKRFRHYATPLARLREALFGGQHHQTHVALNNVSLQVLPGEAVGILGRNGAGKSTLLKLITGVLLPDAGTLQTHGRLTGLLELGAGFDSSLTGLENIRINGTLLGLDDATLARRRDDIIAFSELGDFIHQPVRTYSSGMVMRLGFAIAIHADPACFIVDEALAVGDARFQQKCLKRIREYRQAGGALLFVSHDINAVKLLCDRAVVMEQGELVFDGTPVDASQHYYRLIAGLPDDASWQHPDPSPSQYGHRQTHIQAVTLHDDDGHPVERLVGGRHARIRLRIASQVSARLSVGILLRDRLGQDIFGTNTALLGDAVAFAAGSQQTLEFRLPVSLAPGKYTLTVAVHSDDTHVHDCHHWWDDALSLEITGHGDTPFTGLVSLPVTWRTLPADA